MLEEHRSPRHWTEVLVIFALCLFVFFGCVGLAVWLRPAPAPPKDPGFQRQIDTLRESLRITDDRVGGLDQALTDHISTTSTETTSP